jgi:hypothetical protein
VAVSHFRGRRLAPCVGSGSHARGVQNLRQCVVSVFFVPLNNKASSDMTSMCSLESLEEQLRNIINTFTLDDWDANVCCLDYHTGRMLLIIIRILFCRESAC